LGRAHTHQFEREVGSVTESKGQNSTEETEEWVLHIANAVAAANPGTPRGAINRRVWGAISSALMRSIGKNALDFRNGKLLRQ
jgi:hypothetical protein